MTSVFESIGRIFGRQLKPQASRIVFEAALPRALEAAGFKLEKGTIAIIPESSRPFTKSNGEILAATAADRPRIVHLPKLYMKAYETVKKEVKIPVAEAESIIFRALDKKATEIKGRGKGVFFLAETELEAGLSREKGLEVEAEVSGDYLSTMMALKALEKLPDDAVIIIPSTLDEGPRNFVVKMMVNGNVTMIIDGAQSRSLVSTALRYVKSKVVKFDRPEDAWKFIEVYLEKVRDTAAKYAESGGRLGARAHALATIVEDLIHIVRTPVNRDSMMTISKKIVITIDSAPFALAAIVARMVEKYSVVANGILYERVGRFDSESVNVKVSALDRIVRELGYEYESIVKEVSPSKYRTLVKIVKRVAEDLYGEVDEKAIHAVFHVLGNLARKQIEEERWVYTTVKNVTEVVRMICSKCASSTPAVLSALDKLGYIYLEGGYVYPARPRLLEKYKGYADASLGLLSRTTMSAEEAAVALGILPEEQVQANIEDLV